jgi:DNA polymerase III sliding clamp (beta) subunit (PCNA family)
MWWNSTSPISRTPTLIRENDRSPALYVLMPMRV